MDSISRMTTNTKQYMLSRVFSMGRESTLFKALRKNLNMETTKEVFGESCFDGASVQEENTDNFPGDLYLAETPHSR